MLQGREHGRLLRVTDLGELQGAAIAMAVNDAGGDVFAGFLGQNVQPEPSGMALWAVYLSLQLRQRRLDVAGLVYEGRGLSGRSFAVARRGRDSSGM